MLFLFVFLFAAVLPAYPQDSRAERLQQQRQKKSLELRPSERNGLEKILFEFKDRRIMERYQAGFKGFHPMLGGLATGSGFALGTQYAKTDIMNGMLSFRASGQASFAAYQKYGLALEAPRIANELLSVSFNFTQRNYPQEDFFGIGSNSAKDDRTNYRLEDTDYAASVAVRPLTKLTVGTRLGILNTNTAPGTDTRFPSIERLFGATSVPALDRQPDYGYAGAFIQYDRRDEPLNPRSGGLYRAEGGYYDDRDTQSYSFRRWEMELQQYFPFFNERRVVAFRSRLALTDTNAGQDVPFFLLPTLGGSDDLRGFSEYRFRDKNSLLFNLEYRWEAFSGLDLALFGDAGNVFKDAGDIDLNELKTAYGFGFRFNTHKSVFWRIDVGFGQEGTHMFVKFNHVF
jgi:outer membrane protein assembly factor BamA